MLNQFTKTLRTLYQYVCFIFKNLCRNFVNALRKFEQYGYLQNVLLTFANNP